MRKLFGILLCAAGLLSAQSFEVASIRKTLNYVPGNGVDVALRGGPGTTDPTHVRWNAVCVGSLVNAGFNVRSYQVSGPGLCSQPFDIVATVPEGATKEDLRAMWRGLLKERFGMVAKVERREFDGQELVVGKGGPKLAETTLPVEEQSAPGKLVNGKFQGAGLVTYTKFVDGVTVSNLVAKARSMSDLAGFLSGELGMPVVDATGLAGKYDFEFEYAPRNSRAKAQDTGLDVVTAMGEALGLRLRSAQVPLDYAVIEKIGREPTEN